MWDGTHRSASNAARSKPSGAICRRLLCARTSINRGCLKTRPPKNLLEHHHFLSRSVACSVPLLAVVARSGRRAWRSPVVVCGCPGGPPVLVLPPLWRPAPPRAPARELLSNACVMSGQHKEHLSLVPGGRHRMLQPFAILLTPHELPPAPTRAILVLYLYILAAAFWFGIGLLTALTWKPATHC
jgi:hypothetical protein